MSAIITKSAEKILLKAKLYRVNSKNSKALGNFYCCTETEYNKYTSNGNTDECDFDKLGRSKGYKEVMDKLEMIVDRKAKGLIKEYMSKHKIEMIHVTKKEYSILDKANDMGFVEMVLKGSITIQQQPYLTRYFTITDTEI